MSPGRRQPALREDPVGGGLGSSRDNRLPIVAVACPKEPAGGARWEAFIGSKASFQRQRRGHRRNSLLREGRDIPVIAFATETAKARPELFPAAPI